MFCGAGYLHQDLPEAFTAGSILQVPADMFASDPYALMLAIKAVQLPQVAAHDGVDFVRVGWLKFLLGKRKINYARTILMGVLPEYRKLRVDMAMVYKTMIAEFANGITAGECSRMLADNKPMNRILTAYGAEMYKTYRIYEKAVR